MIELPNRPGYFWDAEQQKLYSKKKVGLRELKAHQPNTFCVFNEPYYSVSHAGHVDRITVSAIKKLIEVKESKPKREKELSMDDLW